MWRDLEGSQEDKMPETRYRDNRHTYQVGEKAVLYGSSPVQAVRGVASKMTILFRSLVGDTYYGSGQDHSELGLR